MLLNSADALARFLEIYTSCIRVCCGCVASQSIGEQGEKTKEMIY